MGMEITDVLEETAIQKNQNLIPFQERKIGTKKHGHICNFASMMPSAEFTIREVEVRDNAPLAKMIRQVFDEHGAPNAGTVYSDPTTDNLFELFRKENSILWVAELQGEAIGCCGIYPTPNLPPHCAELVKFYLAASARGKGLGRMLLEKSLASARSMGYREIYLESLPQFKTAIRIYEKLGFVFLDQPMGASGHSGCNIWMNLKF